MSRAIVLLSGGLDSVVSMVLAREKTDVILALTFDYGQQAAKREITAAGDIASYYEVPHKIISLPWLSEIDTSVLQAERSIPQLEEEELLCNEIVEKTGKAVWVPNRNGLFINIAASFAESLEAHYVIAGLNREEAQTFPDNSKSFVDRTNQYLELATRNKVQVWAPTQEMTKAEIVAVGERVNIPWQYLWSCYGGGDTMCGTCESCRRLKRALKEAKVNAPVFLDQ